MAVYTKLEHSDLCVLLKNYEVGALKTYEGIIEGVENTNYFLETEKGRYILTLYEKRVVDEDLPFFLNLMQHLSQHELATPQPIPQKNGSFLAKINNKTCAITSFLQGEWLREPQAKHCQQVGSALAKMHLAVKDYSLKRKNDLSVQDWRPLWKKSVSKIGSFSQRIGKDVQAIIEDEISYLEQNWPKDLEKGIIHADLFNDNVFFIKDKLSGIIDFYFACEDYFSYDLAITINAWCFDNDFTFNYDKAKKLIENYQKIRSLTEAEKKSMQTFLRGASMRFFLTRLYDWFHVGDDQDVIKKDPLEYWEKLHFFKSLTTINAIGF